MMSHMVKKRLAQLSHPDEPPFTDSWSFLGSSYLALHLLQQHLQTQSQSINNCKINTKLGFTND